RRAQAAIETAQSWLDQSDPAKGQATDFLRAQSEEQALRARTIAALAPVAASNADKQLLADLRGDYASAAQHWGDALDAYRAALALDPHDASALAGTALAADRLGRYDEALAADEQLVAFSPRHVEPLLDLGELQVKAKRYAEANATLARAATIAAANVKAKPHDELARRLLAFVHLDAGRAFAAAREVENALHAFARSLELAGRLPASDSRHDMYIEENQEAIAALGIAAPHGPASLSLAPWIGPDLPGSAPGTRKYRLVVAGGSGRTVALHAVRVPAGWVAAFCTDKVCAPNRTQFALPSSGVKIVELTLVPPSPTAATPKVQIVAVDGGHISSATL
ncbi:MAG: tetratricopeptide repeat protein, partial [Vulcanimicrobiaceae bacterium]